MTQVRDFCGICKECLRWFDMEKCDGILCSQQTLLTQISCLIGGSDQKNKIAYIRVPLVPHVFIYDTSELFGYKIIFDNKPLKIFYEDESVWMRM